MKRPLISTLFGAFVLFNLTGIMMVPHHTLAQSDLVKPTSIYYKHPAFLKKRDGGLGSGLGDRGPTCPSSDIPLTALVHDGNQGLTTSGYPTLWFYVPYTRANDVPAKLVLKDERGKTIYKIPVDLPEVPGIVGVQLPNTEAPLGVNKQYPWTFRIECREPVEVSGEIQRITIDPKVMARIKTASPRQKAMLYAENGIWYDALTTLGEKLRVTSQDTTLTTEWKNLLNQVGLKSMDSQSIAN